MFFESFLINVGVLLALLVALTFDYVTKFFSYWYVRHLPYKFQIPFFGSDYHRVLALRSNTDEVNKLYAQNPKEKYHGCLKSRIPDLIVKDPDVIQKILSTDFANFHSRGLSLDKSQDVCLRNNLFYADGEKWTLLRESMESLLNNITCDFEDSLHDCLSGTNGDTNVQQLLSEVLDVVFTYLLLQDNEDTSTVKEIRSKIQRRSIVDRLQSYLKNIFPSLYVMFGLITLPGEPSNKTNEALEKSKLINEINKTGPILQLGIKEKNNKKHKIESETDIVFSVFSSFITEGYIPCLHVLTALLFELARNPQVQSKARGPNSQEYLDNAIKETLRLYPSYSVITRKCVKLYHLPENSQVVDKKVTISIPVDAIHKDDKYYSEAKNFNPDRFETGKEQSAYLPFGAGPRKCIGEQLSLQIMKKIARSILDRYEIETTNKTPNQLPVVDHNFGRVVEKDICLKFKPVTA